MEELVIYGCYAEGFVYIGKVDLYPQSPCSRVYDIEGAYASIGISLNGVKPVVLDLNTEGFASGFEVGGIMYLHFKAGSVPEGILIREA